MVRFGLLYDDGSFGIFTEKEDIQKEMDEARTFKHAEDIPEVVEVEISIIQNHGKPNGEKKQNACSCCGQALNEVKK